MISIPSAVFIHIAEPFIAEIITDIVKSSEVSKEISEIKQKFYRGLCEVTSKTSFTLDDILLEACAKTLSNCSVIDKGGSVLLDAIESWVKSTSTKWDDTLILPAIHALRSTGQD